MENGIVCIANNLFETLLAISEHEQQKGLMHVDPPVPIMTFVYAKPRINKFWMSNTKAPLDIIFCNNGKVSEVCYGEPYSTAMIGGNCASNLVVELPFGLAKSSGIKIGQSVGLIKPNHEELRKIFAEKYQTLIKF